MKVFLFGLSGKMGRALLETAAESNIQIVGGFDRVPHPTVPTFTDPAQIDVEYDVIVDFSRPETLDSVIAASTGKNAPVVLATTGYSDAELAKIRKLAERVPVLRSGNMSVGVNVLLELVERAVTALGETYDIEIVEKHHNQKADAPSGTAVMLAEAAAAGRENNRFVFGRQGAALRDKAEIGIHAVRGGTIVGEHDVIFAGKDETITLSHTALSRKIFAVGAFRAAGFLLGAKPGLYTMRDALQ